jgi:mannitol/fructose-specific phosphotransferase system IIA component (Ntr-type)
MDIAEILLASDVNLALRPATKREAITELLGSLRGDGRVKDWDVLAEAVLKRDAAAICEGQSGICIAHGRTAGVSELVMAAGRAVPGTVVPEIGEPVRIYFVVGIPAAFDSVYLQVVGAIARVCRNEEAFAELLAAESGEDFVEALARAAEKL